MRAPWDHIGTRCRRAGALLGLAGCAVLATWSIDRARPERSPGPVVAALATSAPHPADPALVTELPHHPAITARVTVDGAPVADAMVSITDGSRPLLASARSDRDGVVTFPALPPGAYELWATRPGLASPVARIVEAGAPIDLVLAAAGDVRGSVVADGAVPTGSIVQLVPRDVDHVVRIASLDSEGQFALEGVPHGRWRVEATVPGHVQLADQILEVTGRAAPLVIKLQRAGSVRGTVVDATGTPIAHAAIVLRDQAGAAATTQRSFGLGPSRLRWVHPLAGTRLLPVRDSSRYGASRPGARPAECGRGHCGVDLGNQRGSTVHAMADGEVASIFPESRSEAGRLVAIAHGGGLKTFYMHLDEIRGGLEVGQPIRAGDPVGTLGSTGFTRSAPHLHFALTYERTGRTWYLDPELILRHAVVLPVQRALDPVELDPAAPLARGPAVAPPAVHHVTTDAKGAFRVDGVAPGTYVAAGFAMHLAPGASAPFTVKSGADTGGIVVTVRAGVMVTGRVLGRDGPIAGATVIARAGFGETAHKVATTSTDRHGEFTLRSLAGKLTLQVGAPKHGEIERAITVDERDPRRSLRREDFKLTVEDAELRGQVLAADAGPAAGVTVRVLEGPTRRRALTDAQGRFVLAPLATGRYLVELTSLDHPPKRVTLESGRWTELRLDVGGGARCQVREAQSGAALAGIRIEASGPGGQTATRVTDARGGVELRGLVPGAWKLTVRAAGYVPATREVTI
ncbi:MAG: carboxypeptidase regulatory-like domain-containing protein, partial [Myxococcota bacterium]|nr:carboxypeptidase regulatory-like domain-containing protein [Myxococcota bacterium]